mgnify:FL=1
MRSEFQRGYQSIVTSYEEGLQRSGDLYSPFGFHFSKPR